MSSDKQRRKQANAGQQDQFPPQPFVHPDGDRRRRFGVLYRQGAADKRARQTFDGGIPADPPDGEQPMADLVKVSKFLSLVLRHQPDTIGLTLDANGWADVDDLIRLCTLNGRPLTRPLLEQVVAGNDKKRFAFSDDGRRIRASQGHSVEVDLALPPADPPELLYHGTATRFLDSIRDTGLHAGSRQHVHLSIDVPTATKVGRRHGKPVILVVRAREMAAAGHPFFVSANGVWLTDRVPVEFITFPDAP